MSTVRSWAQKALDDGEDIWPPTDADRAEALKDLKEVLVELEPLDQHYEARYCVVLLAMTMAYMAGLESGFVIDDGGRVAACIELPTGQVSWRVPMHLVPRGFASERYERIRAFVEADDCDGTPDGEARVST
jgi:hypothetical protein